MIPITTYESQNKWVVKGVIESARRVTVVEGVTEDGKGGIKGRLGFLTERSGMEQRSEERRRGVVCG